MELQRIIVLLTIMAIASIVDIITMRVHRWVWISIALIGAFQPSGSSLKAVVVIGIPLFILVLLKQLGGGDVKYAMAFALCLGTTGVIAGTAIAYILAAIIVIPFRKIRGRSLFGKFPMIPFLSMGYAAVLGVQYLIGV